jgi:leukotriene-A4 hydrolase
MFPSSFRYYRKFSVKRIIQIALIITLTLTDCNTDKQKDPSSPMPSDPHSYASPVDVRVTHLTWKASIDFSSRIISATATWDIDNYTDSDIALFDTKDLSIQKVTLDDGLETQFKLAEKDSLLGAALAVMIRKDTKKVIIQYQTNPSAEAVQWLEPSQTAGKEHPFMFTQSQAILARSWVPPMFELSGKLDQICSVIVKRDECRWVPKQLLKHVDSQIFASSLSHLFRV